MAEALVGKLGYLGIALVLMLGGLGLPVPEEAPIILAAVLSRNDKMSWPIALSSCFAGVLLGDFIVYFLGYFYGERVLSFPLTRKFLTREREAQIKGYFHRHGFKILILGRFAVGFRTAAYLTAGILKLPPLRLFLTDAFAASLSTLLMFGLGYVFAHQIQTSFDQLKHWFMVIVAVALASWLLYRYYQGRRRAGLPVGPPVLVVDDLPPPASLQDARESKATTPASSPAPAASGPSASATPPVASEPKPVVAEAPKLPPSSLTDSALLLPPRPEAPGAERSAILPIDSPSPDSYEPRS
ncbi:DedA family protein [Singulisphaera sp. PoT]|uniref:DedA family protein n=1 Tax=Singulisphaera sp. PoT TaxID=3411797 RepID=UPI003BF4CC79